MAALRAPPDIARAIARVVGGTRGVNERLTGTSKPCQAEKVVTKPPKTGKERKLNSNKEQLGNGTNVCSNTGVAFTRMRTDASTLSTLRIFLQTRPLLSRSKLLPA
jgi:hypothetical protein